MGIYRNSSDSPYKPSTVLASGVICAYPAKLRTLVLRNTGAATAFIFLFNSITVPTSGVPTGGIPIKIPAGESASLAPDDMTFNVGISWSNSSTDTTLTPGAAEIWIQATFARDTKV